MSTESKKGDSAWIPSTKTESYEIKLFNENHPTLNIEYRPEQVIEELKKLFTYAYLQGNGFKVPLSLLVREDSPLGGILTSWYALGAHSTKTTSDKRRRKTKANDADEALKAIAMGVADGESTEMGSLEKLTEMDLSLMTYDVGRKTTRAANYITEHLQNKLQSSLIELILEAEIFTIRAAALESGLDPAAITNEGQLVDLIIKSVERGIKDRLKTRRPGAKSDSSLESQLRRFAELTNRRRDVAECLVEIAKRNSNADWRTLLETDTNFQYHCRAYQRHHREPAILKAAAEILYKHQNDVNLMTRNKTKWDRATSALAVAQRIAALELGMKDKNGNHPEITTLSNWYSRGGGFRWGLKATPEH